MENKTYWEVWKLTVHTDDGDYYEAQKNWDKYVEEHYDELVNWVDDFKYFVDEYSAREYFNNAKNNLTYRASRVISCFHHDVLLLVETAVRSDDEAFDQECDFDICDTAIGKKCESGGNEWLKKFQTTTKVDESDHWQVWSAWVYIDEEDYFKAWAKWEDFIEKSPQKIPNEITACYGFDDEESARKFFDYYKEKLLYRTTADGEQFMYEVLMLVQTYTSADCDEMDEDDFDIVEWEIAKVYSSPQKKWWQKNAKKI